MQKRIPLLLLVCSVIFLQNCKKDPVIKAPEPDHTHWNYELPDSWGGVNSDCNGVIQSPIDIITVSTLKTNLPDLIFNYSVFPVTIIDNGHTIQVNTKTHDADNTLTFNNNTYKLKQFHFHAKSEHTINAKHAAMEMHLVHANDYGAIVVVGLFIDEDTIANPLINTVWDAFPNETEHEEEKTTTVNVNSVIPAGKGYYNYIGSLTTPPCTMGLQWIVMKEHIKLSAAQIQKFRAKYDHNYRPTQVLNGRVVYEKE